MHPDDPIEGEDAEVVALPLGGKDDRDEELRAAFEEVADAFGSGSGLEPEPEPELGLEPGPEPELELGLEPESGFTHDDYRDATTQAYEGLADMVREADESGPVEQAMTVQIPGLGGGIVGFEDMQGGDLGVAAKTDDENSPEKEFDTEILAELEEQKQRRSNLQQRIGTGLGLIALAALAAYSGPGWFTVFVAIVAFLGTGEFYAVVRRNGYNPVAAIGLLAAIGTFVGAWTIGAAGIAASSLIALVVLVLFYVLNERRDTIANLGVTALGFLWMAGALAFIAPITRMDGWHQVIALVVLTTAGHDVGAFFVGRKWGSHKLAPNLSPNKSIEGLVGGVVLGSAIAVGLSFVPWFSDVVDMRIAIATALVVSVFAPLGDLAESLVKRSLETKDMGTILPGHGGFFDRLDSFAFVIPAIFVAYTFLGLLP